MRMRGIWIRSARFFAVLFGVSLAVRAPGAETADPILQIESGGHTAICRWLGFTPDGRQLVSLGADKVVRVWDMSGVIQAFQQGDKGKPNTPLAKIPLVRSVRLQIGPGDEGKLYAGAISPKPLPGGGWLLAVGGYGTPNPTEHGGDIRLLDLSTGQVLGLLQGHSNVIDSLAFSSDGRTLASGSADRTVRVWGLDGKPGDWTKAADRKLTVKCDVLTGHEEAIYGLTFVGGQEGEATLASGSDDKTLRLWRRDAKGKWQTAAVRREHTADVVRVTASPDGRYLASASSDRSVRLWDAHDGQFVRVLGEIGETTERWAEIAFTLDGQALVAAAYRGLGGCHVWRVSDGKELASFMGHDDTVLSVAVSRVSTVVPTKENSPRAGGTLVATSGGESNDIFLWDAADGRKLGHIVGTGYSVWTVALSPDARWIGWGNTAPDAAIGVRGEGKLDQIFDLSEMQPGRKASTDVNWSRAFLKQAGWSAERSKDAKHTLIVRRDAREIARVDKANTYDSIVCYSFVPNGGLVVGSQFALTLHDPTSGKQLREFTGHTGGIWSVAVSADGRLLVSGSSDQTFRLWNIATGELLLSVFASYEAGGKVGEWVAWTPAGYYKASPGGDKLIGWHVNRGPDKAADFVAAWQMRKLFEKPEIVELIPATLSVKGAVEQYAKDPGHRREEPLKIQEDLERLRPPSVAISEPSNYQRVKTAQVRLRAKVWPTGRQPITEVRVLVNGRPPPDFPGLKPAPGANATDPRDIQTDVSLEPGMNTIEVLATTATATSTPARVDILRETVSADAQPAKPSCYFLGIGVAEYEDKP